MPETLIDMGLAAGLILLALLGWIGVQQWSRDFAARHPEFGPAKEEGGGCGSGCSCSAGSCRTPRVTIYPQTAASRSTQRDAECAE